MISWITPDLACCSMHDDFPNGVKVFSVLDLKDGWNDPFLIYLKAKRILPYLLQLNKVVLFCHAGLSRSPGIAALLMAYLNKTTWDEAYQRYIKPTVPRSFVNMDFRDACIEALKILEACPKKCAYCTSPIEEWEEVCELCWNLKK